MEFPPTCEVRVNSVQLTASLKGLKKKPGTAPPPDLGKYVRANNSTNRVEMVYVNSQQQPVQAKVRLPTWLVPYQKSLTRRPEILSCCPIGRDYVY